MSNKCIFCGSELVDTIPLGALSTLRENKCPTCGTYVYQKDLYGPIITKYKNEFASYLYYSKNIEEDSDKNRFFFIGSERNYEKIVKDHPWVHHITEQEIEAYMPGTFSDTITSILLNYAKRATYIGNIFTISKEEFESSLFIRRYDKKGNRLKESKINSQKRQICEYLDDNKYLEISYTDDGVKILILPEGWKRIEQLQRDDSNNKNVFVSMAFNENTKKTRECIREAIIGAGYSPKFIDEIIHNRQIVPEMFRLIRECRFLILDITEPNYGAYYEAGYALGLGKEVIIASSEEMYNKKYESEEEKKYEKYLKPHFDIAQKQTLIWKDLDDYRITLEQWIKSIIG